MQKRPECRIYANLEIDTVYLGSVNKHVSSYLLVFVAFEVLDPRLLRRLAISTDYWAEQVLLHVLELLCCFPCLREIILVLEGENGEDDRPATLVKPDEAERQQLVTLRRRFSTVHVPVEEFLAEARTEDARLRSVLQPGKLPNMMLKKLEGKVLGKTTEANS